MQEAIGSDARGEEAVAKKATINDIAQNLGLSRNTVSRVLNGNEGISNETRMRVLDEAARVNYKMLGTRIGEQNGQREVQVLLVTKDIELVSSSYFNFTMFILQPIVRTRNASLVIHFMSEQEIRSGRLPPQISETDAVIIFEILDEHYIQLLLNTGKPCVLFDCTMNIEAFHGSFDVVLEDESAIALEIRRLAAEGVRRFGFVGDPNHCLGFRNRYNAFRTGVADCEVGPHEEYDLTEPETAGMNFRRMFVGMLRSRKLPEVYFCANNYLAQRLVEAAEDLGKTVPDCFRVYGFGLRDYYTHGRDKNSEDYRHMEDLMSAVVMALFDRLRNPQALCRIVRTSASVFPVTRDDF